MRTEKKGTPLWWGLVCLAFVVGAWFYYSKHHPQAEMYVGSLVGIPDAHAFGFSPGGGIGGADISGASSSGLTGGGWGQGGSDISCGGCGGGFANGGGGVGGGGGTGGGGPSGGGNR